MKKGSFIVGLIAGILGISSNIILLVIGLNMPVTIQDTNKVCIFSALGLLFSIAGLVGACLIQTKKIMGILLIITGVINIFPGMYSLSADSALTFIMNLVVAIMFIVSGILGLTSKEN